MKKNLLLLLSLFFLQVGWAQNDPAPQLQTRLTEAFSLEMPELYYYPLYARVLNEPDSLTVEQFTFTINGEAHNATPIGAGTYRFWWQPEAYGTYEIILFAQAENGNTASETINLEVVDPQGDRDVQTFEESLINWPDPGQTFQGFFVLPQFTAAYNKITGYLSVTCPSINGGCDDWDRLAHVEVRAPNGEWVEFIRYITPFGVGCDHTIDLTDFASLLQGAVDMRVRIGTWGTGGWNVSLRLEYESGDPEYVYTTVDRIWQANYPFGNPANLDPVPDREVTWSSNIEEAKLRLVTTGHGWGENNTANAAEFYSGINQLLVDDAPYKGHFVWTTCNPNPDGCQPQFGTWQFDRAGWCPGAIGSLREVDMTEWISQGSSTLGYKFSVGYVDQCHPNNPNCFSGITCPNCDDGFNPQYYFSANMITYSNSAPVESVVGISEPDLRGKPVSLQVYPSPSTGEVQLRSPVAFNEALVSIFDVSGRLHGGYFFHNQAELHAFTFRLQHLEKGLYFIRLETDKGQGVEKLILH